jgi:hypothetical protein
MQGATMSAKNSLAVVTTDFQKSTPQLASLPDAQNLKFEREDWSLFRTVEGLQQKAGVPKHKLIRLVLKELADNALDEAGDVNTGELPNKSGYFVEDTGKGIDPEQVARLFSIARPLVSTKLLRLPTRGALGNGLRVVAGAVLASEGSLTVTTRDRRIELRPERDGTTTVVRMTKIKFPIGTRIEIKFGSALPYDQHALWLAKLASGMARGSTYAGRSSPFWYDVPQFHELLYASGDRPVRELIASLDGCTGENAGFIVAVALLAAQERARPVKAERLGFVGPELYPNSAYAKCCGVVQLNPQCAEAAPFGLRVFPVAELPFVVEAWVGRSSKTSLTVCVNRTPITGDIQAAREKRDIDAFGCGLHHTIAQAPADAHFVIVLNIITPYMPITSDGKEPDLAPFLDAISTATSKTVRKAHRPTAGSRTSQKDVVLENLDEVIADVSGDGEFRFNERQVFYALRPIVMNETGEELKINNFKKIITDYEAEHGEIEGMYREPRGSIYHPHIKETITLGTLMVEDYERPDWTFNKAVYLEKEGFSEALKDAGWAERHDCMLMSSKGFTTRAAKDLVDKLAEHDEPVTIYCVHDADAAGTLIYQTFQEETKARGARKIQIVNLGLEPWEAVAMGLEVENVDEGERRKPVADYVRERDDGTDWEEWLQTKRVELNAMTTPEFIAWLDGKMAGYEKLIPPHDVLSEELDARIEEKLRASITERILREANFEAQVADAIAATEKPDAATLAEGIEELFDEKPDAEWRDHIEAVATELADDDGAAS